MFGPPLPVWLLGATISLICHSRCTISTPPGLIGAQLDLSSIASPGHGLVEVSHDISEGFGPLNLHSSIPTSGITADIPIDGLGSSTEPWYKDLVLEDHGVGYNCDFWKQIFDDEFKRSPNNSLMGGQVVPKDWFGTGEQQVDLSRLNSPKAGNSEDAIEQIKNTMVSKKRSRVEDGHHQTKKRKASRHRQSKGDTKASGIIHVQGDLLSPENQGNEMNSSGFGRPTGNFELVKLDIKEWKPLTGPSRIPEKLVHPTQ
ncbi:hypothetical protein PCASD_17098 [Puccinia coronata f. sp. avenae]|uniref:Uncharacterized protein n=1 Tax=Puccinia coronata f. sp. avenae TaxID=200324 RepID=A0A2N5T565_9BASI|nr:hypothetical protein PCASD_17098 [Puccinia coronata f. sp. avenae]